MFQLLLSIPIVYYVTCLNGSEKRELKESEIGIKTKRKKRRISSAHQLTGN